MKKLLIAAIAVVMFYGCRTAKTSVSISNKDSVVHERADSVRLIQKLDASVTKSTTMENEFMLISFDSSASPCITVDSTGAMHFTGVKQVQLKKDKQTSYTDSSIKKETDSSRITTAKDVSVKTHEKIKDKKVTSFTGFYVAAFIGFVFLIIAWLTYRHFKND